MTSAHEYFTCFANPEGVKIWHKRRHAMVETQWDWGFVLTLPEDTLVYNWGYDEKDEFWEDEDYIKINQWLLRLGFLEHILKDMDVPPHRTADINWLKRCLGDNNSTHPNYPRLMRILDEFIPF